MGNVAKLWVAYDGLSGIVGGGKGAEVGVDGGEEEIVWIECSHCSKIVASSRLTKQL